MTTFRRIKSVSGDRVWQCPGDVTENMNKSIQNSDTHSTSPDNDIHNI